MCLSSQCLPRSGRQQRADCCDYNTSLVETLNRERGGRALPNRCEADVSATTLIYSTWKYASAAAVFPTHVCVEKSGLASNAVASAEVTAVGAPLQGPTSSLHIIKLPQDASSSRPWLWPNSCAQISDQGQRAARQRVRVFGHYGVQSNSASPNSSSQGATRVGCPFAILLSTECEPHTPSASNAIRPGSLRGPLYFVNAEIPTLSCPPHCAA